MDGDWERGESIPRFDRAVALARELGVSLKVLAKSMGIDVVDLVNDTPEERSPSDDEANPIRD
jgi:transcriptional regulator with XRE-family HTH domain